jgi:hypothetical protein
VIRWLSRVGALLTVALLALPFAPGVLAFPFHAQFGQDHVASVTRIEPDAARAVLARSHALIASGPLARQPAPPLNIYLTDGGWRWRVLARQPFGGGPFAETRAFSTAVIVNSAELAADRVRNGRAVGGVRTLSGVIAHEATHLMVNRRIGPVAAQLLPAWKREGLADVVARETSLSDADARRLRAAGESHPALPYYDGARRVRAELDRGVSIDALLRP